MNLFLAQVAAKAIAYGSAAGARLTESDMNAITAAHVRQC
jgi:hypothetical protein